MRCNGAGSTKEDKVEKPRHCSSMCVETRPYGSDNICLLRKMHAIRGHGLVPQSTPSSTSVLGGSD